MILPDVNVLLYAFRSDSENHAAHRTWLEGVVNGDMAYGMSPQVLASVIRLATHPRIFVRPSRAGGSVSLRIDAPGSAPLPDHSARAAPLGYLHQTMPERERLRKFDPRRLAGSPGHRIGLRMDYQRSRLCALRWIAVASGNLTQARDQSHRIVPLDAGEFLV